MLENIRFPEAHVLSGKGGTVYVGFLVTKDGKVEHVKVEKGLTPELDEEALRVVKLIPCFDPGTWYGKPVEMRMVFPVRFAPMTVQSSEH